MPRTSNKAELILAFVNSFVQENGFAPSVREIGAAVGLRSTASVTYQLERLQEKGLLTTSAQKGRKRAIATTQRPGQIPVIGVVTAGVPILAFENHTARITFQHLQNGSAKSRLAASGLTNQAEGLAFFDFEADIINRLHILAPHTEVLAKMVYF